MATLRESTQKLKTIIDWLEYDYDKVDMVLDELQVLQELLNDCDPHQPIGREELFNSIKMTIKRCRSLLENV